MNEFPHADDLPKINQEDLTTCRGNMIKIPHIHMWNCQIINKKLFLNDVER